MSHKRTNKSTKAEIYLDRIFASGTFKNVWTGRYTEGRRKGQRCVSKEFKTGSVFEKHFFDEELRIIERTQEIIDDFHAANIILGKDIILNTPDVWTYTESRHKCLIEPMIDNFQKFNSNSGWAASENIWDDAMQALSHFSYHDSNRQFLLCDLQGGSYSNGYILSDPVIMSQSHDYGPADLGPNGINSFFRRHHCGRFCKRQWLKPAIYGSALIPMRQGTTMISLPTRQNRNPLSRVRE
ncbi:hypothetical protein SBOR_9811 [Sclerotinia borealis F-4128]|uniref:Alpha-type protein kinase domain-containing protein n=1 Tax=Sclerotinia borealis (strain F-4128) TaxID=1432307 RepID=W9C5J4_SCLBF|nr:hypothetical protein SBOR_9811 [Sclerotinia borealis F-4128]